MGFGILNGEPLQVADGPEERHAAGSHHEIGRIEVDLATQAPRQDRA